MDAPWVGPPTRQLKTASTVVSTTTETANNNDSRVRIFSSCLIARRPIRSTSYLDTRFASIGTVRASGSFVTSVEVQVISSFISSS